MTAVAVWQITGDGKAYVYEGLALVAHLRDPRDASMFYE